MMTTAYQTVIDNCSSLSINRRKRISQTVSRDGTIKTTSLGGQIWEFRVRLPDGPSYETYRPLIERMEALDRVTAGTIQINSSGHAYISGYQGDLSTLAGITVSYTSGNTVTITGGATGLTTGQYRFKSGDYIQLGSGRVYTVVDDVDHDDTVITLHRPVRESAGSYTLTVGPAVTWTVICTEFPNWTIFSRNQVGWDGDFVFAEVI